jgi:transcriptional regulator with XRE-family HTH domain
MTQTAKLIEQLKRELKARGLTYAELARRIGMSETSIKRMLASRNMSLERLDQILQATQIELTELMGAFDREQARISQLTLKQEEAVVNDPKLFLVAVCTLNLLSYEEILEAYELSEPELVGLLARLDRMGLIELLPNNRFRLKIARTFSWLPNGPIAQAFKNNVTEFFANPFAAQGEALLFVNARLSLASRLALVEKLKRLAREFSEQQHEDDHTNAAHREEVSLLLATRTWHMKAMATYRRKGTKK